MKRRKFLAASLISATMPLTAGARRLYGTPGSIIKDGGSVGEKFVLSLSRAGVPTSAQRTLAAANQVLENVLTSPEEARLFSINPKRYMESFGLDGSDKTLKDDTIILLTALSHSAARESLAASNYPELFEYFHAAGLFEPRDPSKLQVQLENLLRDNMVAIQAAIQTAPVPGAQEQRLMLQVMQESGHPVTEDDLAIVGQLLSSNGITTMSCTAVAMCAVAVGIAATVVTYISVAVAVTIAIMAAVSVSVAAQVAVTVGGGGGWGGGGRPWEPPYNPWSVPFTGTFAKLDPALMRNTERALRIGAISGHDGLRIQALREMISEEVRAVVNAMRSTKLISIDDKQAPIAIEAMTRYAQRTLGI